LVYYVVHKQIEKKIASTLTTTLTRAPIQSQRLARPARRA